jgi:hypothetical protein
MISWNLAPEAAGQRPAARRTPPQERAGVAAPNIGIEQAQDAQALKRKRNRVSLAGTLLGHDPTIG